MPDGMRESKKLTRRQQAEEQNKKIYAKYDELAKIVATLESRDYFTIKLAVAMRKKLQTALIPTQELVEEAIIAFKTICGFAVEGAANFRNHADPGFNPTSLGLPRDMRDEAVADCSIPLPPQSTSDKLQIVYQEDIDKEKADAAEEEST